MKLLTVPEVALRMALSKSHVYGLASQRIIPTVRVGRSLRIPEDALEAWVRERTEHGTESVGNRVDLPAERRPVRGPRRTPPRPGRAKATANGERHGQGGSETPAPGVVRYLEVAEADKPHRGRVARKVAA